MASLKTERLAVEIVTMNCPMSEIELADRLIERGVDQFEALNIAKSIVCD